MKLDVAVMPPVLATPGTEVVAPVTAAVETEAAPVDPDAGAVAEPPAAAVEEAGAALLDCPAAEVDPPLRAVVSGAVDNPPEDPEPAVAAQAQTEEAAAWAARAVWILEQALMTQP